MEYINLENIPRCEQCGGSVNKELDCLYCGNKKHFLKNLIKPEKNIETYYIKTYYKLLEGTLTKEEENNFLNFIKFDIIEEITLNDSIIIFDRISGRKPNYSFELFKELFKSIIVKLMKQINNVKIENFNPRCEIISLDNKGGKCDSSDINRIVLTIDEQRLEAFYKTGELFLLITMFHELEHVIQNIVIKLGIFNGNILSQIKERLIRVYEMETYKTDTYYDNNYENITYEAEARINSVIRFKELLSKYGLNVNQSYLNTLYNNYIGNPDLINRKIIVNNKETYSTIDDIFDMIIQKKPEYLELYPQLKIEYINDNGIIRRKNDQELFITIDAILQDDDADEKIKYIATKLYQTSKSM